MLIGIAVVWGFFSVMAVSLCVMARRADEDLHAPDEEQPLDVAFVATFADTVPAAEPARLRAPSRSTH